MSARGAEDGSRIIRDCALINYSRLNYAAIYPGTNIMTWFGVDFHANQPVAFLKQIFGEARRSRFLTESPTITKNTTRSPRARI